MTSQEEILPTTTVNDWLFDKNEMPDPSAAQIHVLVVVPRPDIEAEPSARSTVLGRRELAVADRAHEAALKRTKRNIPCSGPLRATDLPVPLDTIPAFQQIKEGFSACRGELYLLYGPRQFGKTTIADAIADWVVQGLHVECVFHELTAHDVVEQARFWRELGKSVDEQSSCSDADCHDYGVNLGIARASLGLAARVVAGNVA